MRHSNVRTLFLLTLMSSLACGLTSLCRARAEPPTGGAIAGQVHNEEGVAVAGATVRLWSPPGKKPQQTLATATTNDKGEFAFKEIPPAQGYVVAAETQERWGSRGKLAVQAGKTTEMGVLKIVKGARM